MKSYDPEIPELHMSEPCQYLIVYLCVYAYRSIHVHVVVGSDEKIGKYEDVTLTQNSINRYVLLSSV